MSTMTALKGTLDLFLESEDFRAGVISATQASWGGSGYSVELDIDGTWRVLWNGEIGNKYETQGLIVALPVIEEEGMEPDASLEDMFGLCQAEQQEELRQAFADAMYATKPAHSPVLARQGRAWVQLHPLKSGRVV